MLHKLSIKNYVLVESLELNFEQGFSVITGETGAGKSVMLSAIALLLGQRADLKAIKEGCDRCVLEAEFGQISHLQSFFEANDLQYDGDVCIIRRELSQNGKSRAFVNDSPVSLTQLKALGPRLVDIHSQHENLHLGDDHFQLEVLDTIAQTATNLQEYSLAFAAYQQAEKEAARLEKQLQEQALEQDYLQFQYQQLRDAQLQSGEQQDLEMQRDSLEHAEEIKRSLAQINDSLSQENGVCALLKSALQQASQVRKYFSVIDEVQDRMDSCLIELKDIQRDIERWTEQSEVDPQALERVEQRLNLLYDLQQKHRCASADELLPIRDALAEKLSVIDKGDELLQAARQEAEQKRKAAENMADKLSKQRHAVLKSIEDYMMMQLQSLGMPYARFSVQIEEKNLSADGKDKISFLFSANKKHAAQPITQIASGGEISRLMLCLKALMAEVDDCACLLFDEIDTGVSGEIAHKMALLMQDIAQHRQVLCITHLPQIAAKGRHHYKVYKNEEGEEAISKACLLSKEERLHEIAQMLSGESVSSAAIDHAKILLNN